MEHIHACLLDTGTKYVLINLISMSADITRLYGNDDVVYVFTVQLYSS